VSRVWNGAKMSSEIKNNFESKCSYKIESNSKGFNTTIHVYEGPTQEEISPEVSLWQ
jgi:hypothetical protein